MKWHKRFTLLLLIGALSLYGCAGRESPPARVESRLVWNDTFRVTYFSRQYEYRTGSMQEEAPLHFELWLEYIGEEPSVTIWHCASIGGVEMLDSNGEPMLPLVIGDTLCSTELERGKSCLVTVWTGACEYDEWGGFPEGDYIARAFVDFSFGGGEEENVRCVLDLPFTIRA